MANGLQTRALFQGIAAGCVAAWTVTSVDPGRPRTTPRTLPYAVVLIDPVQIQFNGNGTLQQHSFRILGRFAFPASPDTTPIELEKVDRANEMIQQLQPGPNFASVGILPYVSGVDFTESDDVEEGAYEVTLTFSVATTQDHH